MKSIQRISTLVFYTLAAVVIWIWREQMTINTIVLLIIMLQIIDINSRLIDFVKRQNLGYCDACGEFDRLDQYKMCRKCKSETYELLCELEAKRISEVQE